MSKWIENGREIMAEEGRIIEEGRRKREDRGGKQRQEWRRKERRKKIGSEQKGRKQCYQEA